VTVTLFYASDIHGSELLWRKFVNAGHFYGADVLVMGGDLAGKAVVPVIERGEGRWEAAFAGRRVTAKNERELAELEDDIRFNGMYPHRCRSDDVSVLATDEHAQEQLLEDLAGATVERWLAFADERLAASGAACYVMPGNDDPWSLDAAFLRSNGHVENCDKRIVALPGGYSMLSLSYANPTPWNSPRELPEEELAAEIDLLAEQIPDMRKAIFNLHVPPIASDLDSAPDLDEELRPRYRGGSPLIAAVGSVAVREAIERYQPLLGLHGHIHESRGVVKIGKTTCINPGSTYNTGRLDGVIVRLGDDVERIQLTSG
jgi:Icc-related predicted phosphoesterase